MSSLSHQVEMAFLQRAHQSRSGLFSAAAMHPTALFSLLYPDLMPSSGTRDLCRGGQ